MAGGPTTRRCSRIVTSANVACGFHAGDPSIMRATCATAVGHGVAIGAQVGYPDLAGFGRRFIDIAPAELTDAVLYQIGALDAFARAAGGRVAYVKPHGALYNAIVHHEAQAAAVVAAIVAWERRCRCSGCPASAVPRRAARRRCAVRRRGLRRPRLPPDGTLVPRGTPARCCTDPAAVADAGAAVGRRAASARSASTATRPAPWPCAGARPRAALAEAGVDVGAVRRAVTPASPRARRWRGADGARSSAVGRRRAGRGRLARRGAALAGRLRAAAPDGVEDVVGGLRTVLVALGTGGHRAPLLERRRWSAAVDRRRSPDVVRDPRRLRRRRISPRWPSGAA